VSLVDGNDFLYGSLELPALAPIVNDSTGVGPISETALYPLQTHRQSVALSEPIADVREALAGVEAAEYLCDDFRLGIGAELLAAPAIGAWNEVITERS